MQWKHIGTEATAAKFGKKTMVSNEKNVNLVGYKRLSLALRPNNIYAINLKLTFFKIQELRQW